MDKPDKGYDYRRYRNLLAEATDESKRLAFIDLLIEEGMISPQDVDLFHFVDTPEAAWAIIKDFYSLPD